MSSVSGDPAPSGSASGGSAQRAVSPIIDVLLFLSLIAFMLGLLDVVAGWAIAGLFNLSETGMIALSAAIAVPLGYAGFALGRTALAAWRDRRCGDDMT